MPNFLEEAKEKVTQELKLKYIILDCSCVNYIDNQGVDTLIQVNFDILTFNFFTL
jgi:anti-anti-sigma regulatory factor